MTIQAVVATPQFPQVFVFDGGLTTGSVTAPRGATRVTVEAIGGGGGGFGTSTAGLRAGGSGGGYARTINLAVTGGVTVVYYQAGGAQTQSWVNVGTNIAPTTSATGCLAGAGNQASSGVPGTGSNTPIGTTTAQVSGNGTSGAAATGGGASGAGATIAGAAAGGSGTTAGTDTTGMSLPSQLMGNGTGGAFGAFGTFPGGGGGGSSTTIAGSNGASGRVRIIFYG